MASSLVPSSANPFRLDLWSEGEPDRAAASAPPPLQTRHATDGLLLSAVHQPEMILHPAPVDRATGAAVLVCPGGGYNVLAVEKEGTEVAGWLNTLGITAAILHYRLRDHSHPAPLRDVLRALRLLRSRSAALNLRPDRIGVLGFSAGGHLAACASTLHHHAAGRTGVALDAVSARPDFTILLYPVISLLEAPAHRGSRNSLLGPAPDAALLELLSPDRQVRADTPPAFLVHTADDPTVPAENSLLYYRALQHAGVPAELHLYESGPHGIGLRPEHPAGRNWPIACASWLRTRALAQVV